MKISDVKLVLPYLEKAGVTPMLWGSHGIGKTELVGQFAAETGREFVTLNLGSQEVGDLLGILIEDKKTGVARYQLPEWFPTDPDSKGILFLDEINRAQRYVLQAVFSLVLDKRLHRSFLPKGWSIVAAANPATEDYTVTDISDEALMSRFCHIKVNNEVEEWYEYAGKVGVPDIVRSFALEQRNIFNMKEFDLPKFKPSRRNLNALGRVMAAGLPECHTLDLAIGILGSEAGVAFFSHTKDYSSAIRGSEVLSNFKKVKSRLEKLTKEGSRNDVIYNTSLDVIVELEKLQESKAVDAGVMKNLRSYIKAIPKDLSLGFVLDVLARKTVKDLIAEDKEVVEYFKGFSPAEKKKVIDQKNSEKTQAAA